MRVPHAALARVRATAGRTSLILCYHGVAATRVADDPHFFCVAPRRLRAQIALLQAAGFRFVTVGELAASGPADGVPPPAGLVALSFDDGWHDNHANLLPLLKTMGVPATIFVVSGLMGLPNPWIRREANMRMMSEAEVRDCVAAGLEIGAHTVTHPDLSLVSRYGCDYEIGTSRRVLQDVTQTEVGTFAYPYFHYGPDAVQAVRDSGFSAAAAGREDRWDPFALPRTLITGKDGAVSFVLKVLGRYDRLWSSRAGATARLITRTPRRVARAVLEGGDD
jgi:peptidoglycan/xylan/chitin deacetylase (PgdA/CDA1 family)